MSISEDEWISLLDQALLEFALEEAGEAHWDALLKPRPITDEDVAQLLEDGVRWLHEHGWIQHQPFARDEYGHEYACVNGALYAAGLKLHNASTPFDKINGPDAEWRTLLWYQTLQAIHEHVGEESWQWNDSVGQSKFRVIATLEAIAHKLRSAAQLEAAPEL